MLKITAVLFVLGIALGLWIGFNPQAREKAAQGWEDTKALFVKAQADVSAAIDGWMLDLKSSGQAGTRQVESVWKELSSVLTTLWDSMQRLWANLTVRLRINS